MSINLKLPKNKCQQCDDNTILPDYCLHCKVTSSEQLKNSLCSKCISRDDKYICSTCIEKISGLICIRCFPNNCNCTGGNNYVIRG